MQGAWKVGVLVILFVALLFGAYALLGQNLFREKSVRYFADFSNAQGASVGTPVLMAGVQIGRVSNVDLPTPVKAKLTLDINPKYPIPAGSTAEIQSSIIGLGQNPLIIVPPDHATANLPPGSKLHGETPSPVEAYLPGAKATLAQLNKTLKAAQDLLQDERLKGGIADLLQNSSKTVQQFDLLAQHANVLLAENQAPINRAVASAAAAMDDVQKSTAILAKFAQDPRWRDQIEATLLKLNQTSTKASQLVQNLNDFVTDPKLQEPIKETVANTASISETGKQIASNTEVISKNGIVMSQKAIEIEDKAKILEDSAKGVLDKLQNFFGFKKAAPQLLGGLTGSIDFIRETNPGHTRTDINLTIPLKYDLLHLGLFDAFETNKVNAELGRKFGQGSEYMYGIYASKPAIGVDYRLAPRVFLRGDLYDINDPRLDLRARIEFGGGFYGWLGVNQVFKNPSPLIGIGFRR